MTLSRSPLSQIDTSHRKQVRYPAPKAIGCPVYIPLRYLLFLSALNEHQVRYLLHLLLILEWATHLLIIERWVLCVLFTMINQWQLHHFLVALVFSSLELFLLFQFITHWRHCWLSLGHTLPTKYRLLSIPVLLIFSCCKEGDVVFLWSIYAMIVQDYIALILANTSVASASLVLFRGCI